MQLPKDRTIFEGELASFWFDENGFLCAQAKNTPRTLERQKENYALIRKISGNKKVCLLTDTTSSSAQDRATREYTATEIPHIFKAMAIISTSAAGRMVANLFIALKDNPIPIKIFGDESSAREWLKTYL